MSRQAFFWFFLMAGILLLSGESNAECNGVTPVEGENWVIDELTHCWDESFEINDMEVNNGGLRLENVTMLAHGKITINHPTIWEKSSIFHNSSSNEDHILLQSQLTIKGTNLTINAPEYVYSGSDVQGIKLGTNSKLIITDIDNNYKTQHDASNISSMNWNTSDVYQGGIEFVGTGDDELVVIKNSIMWHISQISTYSHNTIISNNTFYKCAKLQQSWGDNLTFENNYVYNTTYDVTMRYWGSNATIVNNYVEENRGAFHLVDSHNGLVMNNTFVNITGAHSSLGSWGNSRNITWVGNTMNNVENYGFTLYGSEDSIIINNSFYKVADPILAGGENITITGNVMDDCGWDYSFEYVGGCITIASNYSPGNITVYNNTMVNAKDVGIIIGSSSSAWSNITIYDNHVEDSLYGLLMTTYASLSERPSNVSIFGNSFKNHERGIGVSRSYEAKGGNNIQIHNNQITNSTRGITYFGTTLTYKNLTIKDNFIQTNETGIYIDDVDGISILENDINSGTCVSMIDTKDFLISLNNLKAKESGVELLVPMVISLGMKLTETAMMMNVTLYILPKLANQELKF